MPNIAPAFSLTGQFNRVNEHGTTKFALMLLVVLPSFLREVTKGLFHCSSPFLWETRIFTSSASGECTFAQGPFPP